MPPTDESRERMRKLGEGTWDNLKVMQQPGVSDMRRIKHGGKRKLAIPLTEEELDEVEGLLALPHVIGPDRFAAEEIVRLRKLIARVDTALEKGPVESRRFDSRTLLDQRAKLSAQMLRYLQDFGLTPKSRADWAKALSDGGIADRIRNRLEEAP